MAAQLMPSRGERGLKTAEHWLAGIFRDLPPPRYDHGAQSFGFVCLILPIPFSPFRSRPRNPCPCDLSPLGIHAEKFQKQI